MSVKEKIDWILLGVIVKKDILRIWKIILVKVNEMKSNLLFFLKCNINKLYNFLNYLFSLYKLARIYAKHAKIN
jgi:hypothetical protein